jgi:sarcosine oxidase/L-pipecolate oxidase
LNGHALILCTGDEGPPAFTGVLTGRKSFWSPEAGWANDREAPRRMAAEAASAGVQYISGDADYVKRLLFDEMGACLGAQTTSGTMHFADIVVFAAGANATTLLDMRNQLTAKGHTVGHLQLSPDEILKYNDILIVEHLEGGRLHFCFPPFPS